MNLRKALTTSVRKKTSDDLKKAANKIINIIRSQGEYVDNGVGRALEGFSCEEIDRIMVRVESHVPYNPASFMKALGKLFERRDSRERFIKQALSRFLKSAEGRQIAQCLKKWGKIRFLHARRSITLQYDSDYCSIRRYCIFCLELGGYTNKYNYRELAHYVVGHSWTDFDIYKFINNIRTAVIKKMNGEE